MLGCLPKMICFPWVCWGCLLQLEKLGGWGWRMSHPGMGHTQQPSSTQGSNKDDVRSSCCTLALNVPSGMSSSLLEKMTADVRDS